MKYPEWLAGELDKTGALNAGKHITRAEAVTAVRNAVLAHNDPVLITGLIDDFAARALDSWRRDHRQASAAVFLPEAQSELFPDLPARMYVRPGTTKPVILFTAHDWDMAKAVLDNRTTSSIKAAEADRAHFQAAYEKVRPLLSGELTTADVAGQLDGAYLPHTGT